jgi:MazG family protein
MQDPTPTSRPTAGEAFEQLVSILARLRAPDGCPWDREQTHETLRTHLIEEAYETLDAIERGHDNDLKEELGDLLMQPLFHAQIAGEEARFDIVDVLHEINSKLIRRHPHVFGDVQADSTDKVLANWDAIKKQEKAAKSGDESTSDGAPSVLDDVPEALPSLMLALKISKKAAKAGFEWPDVQGVMDKLREETAELEVALQEGDKERVTEELGDLLFTAVNVARWQKINPELALRDMVRRFTARFQAMEAEAHKRGLDIHQLSPEVWDELWNLAKQTIDK